MTPEQVNNHYDKIRDNAIRILADMRNTPKQIKAGRNDPCTCGSNKKYKKCCGGK